jgi:hypothetical protein
MTDTSATFIAAILGAAGAAVEINLARVFIQDWLAGRREQRAIEASPRSSLSDARPLTAEQAVPPRQTAKLWPLAATITVISAAVCGQAARAETPNSDALSTPSATTSLLLGATLASEPIDPPPAAAKPLTISTDRPGFSDSSGIAPVGHLQLETGYTFTFRDRDGVESHTHNAPEVLVRVGIIEDRLELRAGTSGYIWSRSNSGTGFESVEGFSDGYAGFKLKVLDQDGAIPRLVVEGITTLSLGSHNISNRDLEPTAKLIASWDLGAGFTLTSNAVLTYATTSGQRFLQGAGSASLGYAVSDNVSAFIEYFVVGPRTKGSDAAHAIDFGGAVLLNSRTQLDARLGFGINSEADNFFAGVGLSFLF